MVGSRALGEFEEGVDINSLDESEERDCCHPPVHPATVQRRPVPELGQAHMMVNNIAEIKEINSVW